MKIIGITGNVASGKNTVADIFVKIMQNSVIFDADIEAKNLLQNKEVIHEVFIKLSSNIIENNKINRQKLGCVVFADKKKLAILENIIHPKIAQKRSLFISRAKKENKDFILLNTPLLFEKKLHHLCHKTILIICDKEIKKQRFLLRAKHQGLSCDENNFYQKLNNQNTDIENIKIADFSIENNKNLSDLFIKIEDIIKKI
jgi:dephospho-CoA kinase